VEIVVTSRQNGQKFTTKLTGLETFGIDPAEFSKSASKRYACSCSTSADMGKMSKFVSIIMHGDVAAALQKQLQQEFGIPAPYIDVVKKLKKSSSATKKVVRS